MGSIRSASTAYSSSGLFGQNQHNSVVYSGPEVSPGQALAPPHHKMSLYERLVGRKSVRGQHRQNSKHGGQKSNGSAIPITLRNRPRIPTPDVSKEVIDRENRIAMGVQNMGVITAQGYQSEVSVLGALVLSPIQELDGGSVNNTLHAGQPMTTALAQAVLPQGLLASGPVALSPVGEPCTPHAECRGEGGGQSTRDTVTPSLRTIVTEMPPSDRDSEHSTSIGTPPEFARNSSGAKRGEIYV